MYRSDTGRVAEMIVLLDVLADEYWLAMADEITKWTNRTDRNEKRRLRAVVFSFATDDSI